MDFCKCFLPDKYFFYLKIYLYLKLAFRFEKGYLSFYSISCLMFWLYQNYVFTKEKKIGWLLFIICICSTLEMTELEKINGNFMPYIIKTTFALVFKWPWPFMEFSISFGFVAQFLLKEKKKFKLLQLFSGSWQLK